MLTFIGNHANIHLTLLQPGALTNTIERVDFFSPTRDKTIDSDQLEQLFVHVDL